MNQQGAISDCHGFKVDRITIYHVILGFLTDKQGKAVHFTYQERLQLVALTCQVAHGKFDPSTAPPLGVLDVIGKDRRQVLSFYVR